MFIKYSVVIPCYNSSLTIEKCLISVFEQSYMPKEIIVIDDGSTDDSLDKLSVLKDKCPNEINFIILKQTNSGPSVARNNGIKVALYDWIAFLDSDDYWIKTHLEILSKIVKLNPSLSIVGTNNNVKKRQIFFKDLLYRNYFQTSSVIVKREIILKNLFNENQKYGEDYRTWLSILFMNKGFLFNAQHAYPVFNRKLVYKGGGLSSNLNKMQEGEISNYIYLYNLNMINRLVFYKVVFFSYIKFIRRKLFKIIYS